jgi:hypothetical protein
MILSAHHPGGSGEPNGQPAATCAGPRSAAAGSHFDRETVAAALHRQDPPSGARARSSSGADNAEVFGEHDPGVAEAPAWRCLVRTVLMPSTRCSQAGHRVVAGEQVLGSGGGVGVRVARRHGPGAGGHGGLVTWRRSAAQRPRRLLVRSGGRFGSELAVQYGGDRARLVDVGGVTGHADCPERPRPRLGSAHRRGRGRAGLRPRLLPRRRNPAWPQPGRGFPGRRSPSRVHPRLWRGRSAGARSPSRRPARTATSWPPVYGTTTVKGAASRRRPWATVAWALSTACVRVITSRPGVGLGRWRGRSGGRRGSAFRGG